MAKRQTTVRIDSDLDQPLEDFMVSTKVNLTKLFNIFLRELLGTAKDMSLLDRVDALEREVGEIKSKLDSWLLRRSRSTLIQT